MCFFGCIYQQFFCTVLIQIHAMCLFADVITDVRQTEDVIPVITAAEHLADMWTEQQ